MERLNGHVDTSEKLREILVEGSTVMVDIDLIIVNSALYTTKIFNETYNCKFNYQDIDQWKIFVKWGLDLGISEDEALEFNEWVWYDPEVLSKCPPIIGAKPLIHKLHRRGLDVHLLTARRQYLEGTTKDWIARWLPEFDLTKIHHEEDKPRIINKYGARALIDDAQHNIGVVLEHTEAYGIFVPFGKTPVTLPNHERLIVVPRGKHNQNIWPLYDHI